MTPPTLYFSPRMIFLQENKANCVNSLLSIAPTVTLSQTHADGNAKISCGKETRLDCKPLAGGQAARFR